MYCNALSWFKKLSNLNQICSVVATKGHVEEFGRLTKLPEAGTYVGFEIIPPETKIYKITNIQKGPVIGTVNQQGGIVIGKMGPYVSITRHPYTNNKAFSFLVHVRINLVQIVNHQGTGFLVIGTVQITRP